MFDIGFSELVLVCIVGLVVLGPKRLPVAIRTVMSWVSTIRGMAANVQNELKQELKLQELQESIKKAEQFDLAKLSPDLHKTVEELKASAEKMKADLAKQAEQANTSIEQQIETLREQNAQTASEADSAQQISPSEQLSVAEQTEQNETESNQSQLDYLSQYYVEDDFASTPTDSSNPTKTN